MTQKIAVAIVHGVGKQGPDFADGMIEELRGRYNKAIRLPGKTARSQLVFEPVYWAPVLQKREDRLWNRLKKGGRLDYRKLRRFMVDFAADGLAYQPAPSERTVYTGIHEKFAKALRRLASPSAAGPHAPLVVISHSLGTIISSNYIYDLQSRRMELVDKKVKKHSRKTPLECGNTLSTFFTMGSPIALWSLRYKNFGKPVQVPAQELRRHHARAAGGWMNFYDPDDVVGYPLRSLNAAYKKMVTQDRAVNVGGWMTSWNPASHTGYWTDNDVTKPIAAKLVEIWKSVN